MLDIHVHQLLLYAVFGEALVCFLEIFHRGNIVLELLRCALTVLQGSWFWQVKLNRWCVFVAVATATDSSRCLADRLRALPSPRPRLGPDGPRQRDVRHHVLLVAPGVRRARRGRALLHCQLVRSAFTSPNIWSVQCVTVVSVGLSP